MTAAATRHIVDEPGNGRLEIFPLDTAPDNLLALLRDLFQDHWRDITFGTLIQGAVYEIKATDPPKPLRMLDGYCTIDFGAWHMHLCIAEHKGSTSNPVTPELAHHRRTARAELYRRLDPDGHPVSWALRLLNGQDEQQLTVFLPNPFLGEHDRILDDPDWHRLALWDHLRDTVLHRPSDPNDRLATRFVHD